MKVLFIEDEKISVEPVILHIQKHHACEVASFPAAEKAVQDFQPDIVVLDLLEDGGTGDPLPEGNKALDFVWNSRFCPIVVYSAHLDRLTPGVWSDHPFVKLVQKGSGSERQVEEALKLFDPHITALHEAEYFVRGIFANTMRDVAPYAFVEITEEDKRKDAILRSGRRRLAAFMDDAGTTKLASWEVYICPPVSANVKLGDVLRMKNGSADDATAFRVILTPSCDMVPGRNARIEGVLVARCCKNDTGLQTLGIAGAKAEKITTYLLTTGYRDGILPLPALKGRIPSMMADLKKIELLPLADIGDELKNYVRIASIDSPFRELIAWAYSNTACRPGLPDRDFDTWAAEIASIR